MRRRVVAIETTYNGHQMRSRLEADWATFLDRYEVTWSYEAEHLRLGEAIYVPDFWLPETKTVIEVKGMTDHRDYKALVFGEALAREYGVLTVVGRYPAGRTFEIVHPTPQEVNYFKAASRAHLSTAVFFAGCRECGRWQFIESAMSWECRVCGFYAGGGTFSDFIYPSSPRNAA